MLLEENKTNYDKAREIMLNCIRDDKKITTKVITEEISVTRQTARTYVKKFVVDLKEKLSLIK